MSTLHVVQECVPSLRWSRRILFQKARGKRTFDGHGVLQQLAFNAMMVCGCVSVDISCRRSISLYLTSFLKTVLAVNIVTDSYVSFLLLL